MNPPIVVLSTARNVGQWAYRCVSSVREQDTPSTHLFISDASYDRPDPAGVSWTDQAVQRAMRIPNRCEETRTVHVKPKKMKGQIPNMVDTIYGLPDEAIVVHLDGDDWLLPGALKIVREAYASEDVWMTYGQFTHFSGEPGWAREYPSEIIEANAFREYDFYITHLKTFRAGLFKQIAITDFLLPAYWGPEDVASGSCVYPKEPEAWISSAVDIATMFPLIEMAGKHHKFIETPLMIYNNTGNPNSDHNSGKREFQLAECKRLMARKPYQPLTERPW